MRYFVIKNGIIDNVIEAGPDFEVPGATLVPAEGMEGSPGWAWNGAPVRPIEQKPPATNADVNRERDRRTHAGFIFMDKLYQFDPASKARVTGAATLAKFAVLKGAQPGDLRWINPDVDFSWIAADNTLTTMDAQTCSAFGDAAAVHEQRHVFAARAIKAMDPIPADYADDKYWS